MKASKRRLSDPNQAELGLPWESYQRPFRLQAGDVIRYDGRLCRVLHVNDCAAVVMMNRPVRNFKTRFDKPVRFQPPPMLFRISPQSDVPILNSKMPRPHLR
jgi:RecB family endonuclease NucS